MSINLTAIIEIAIALVFAYVLLSLLVTQANSAVGWLLKLRARTLVNFIRDELLQGDMEQLLKHPLVDLVHENGMPKRDGSYVAAGLFVAGLLDEITAAGDNVNNMNLDTLRNKINTLQNERLKKTLLGLLKPVNTLEEAVTTLEDWFEERVALTTQLYQRNMGIISFIIGLILAVTFNVDTIRIIETLWNDPALRQQVAANATSSLNQLEALIARSEAAPDDESFDTAEINAQLDDIQSTLGLLQASDLPVWWTGENAFVLPRSLIGWLLTAVATAKGAPFWFDFLQRLTTRRG